MAEYVDKNALLDEICRDNCERPYDGKCHNCRMTETIADFPAADVAEVRHGKWIYDKNGMDFGLGAWVCSECHCKNNNLSMDGKINPYLFSGSKYCPNCGAKMEG